MLPQRLRHMAGFVLSAALAACALLVPAAGHAAVVELHAAERITATADFRPGKPGKPAILVLHGFLQTREFGIVKGIADALADEGYTVLSPSLSLGISYRRNSLDCEALHLHDMEGDVREIQQWVQWLRGRGYREIIGIGHSFGAAQLIAWREQHREKGVALIGVSPLGSAPFTLEPKPARTRKPASRKKPQAGLIEAPLSYCETYVSPADKYGSYYHWSNRRVIAALKHPGFVTDILLGSEDRIPPPDWGARLAQAGARIHAIKGANHFMDGMQEFDMLETILGILKQ